jgi:hypothetical protein
MTTWFCWDCKQVRELDGYARCASCGSGCLTPAALTGSGLLTAPQEQPGAPIPSKHKHRVEMDWYRITPQREAV